MPNMATPPVGPIVGWTTPVKDGEWKIESGDLKTLYQSYPIIDGLETCGVCGEQHVNIRGLRTCISHNKSGRPCRVGPMTGAVVCRVHGGNGAQQRIAKKNIAEAEAERILAEVAVIPIGNPIDELAALAAEALAIKDHFANIINEIDVIRYQDDKGGEQLRSEVALYERAIDRSEKFLTGLVKIDFEQKRIALEEKRAHLVMLYINVVLTRLGHSFEDPAVKAIIELAAPILDGADASPFFLDAEEVVEE